MYNYFLLVEVSEGCRREHKTNNESFRHQPDTLGSIAEAGLGTQTYHHSVKTPSLVKSAHISLAAVCRWQGLKVRITKTFTKPNLTILIVLLRF